MFVFELNIKKKIAFTLAEVLITLGIIGVVAALTVPTVIQSYQKNSYAEKVKKTFSTIEQAIKLSEADNGTWRTWYYGSTTNDPTEVKNFAETYLVPYLNIIQNCANSTGCWASIHKWNGAALAYDDRNIYYKFILADGTAIHVAIPVNKSVYIHFDINGQSGPNIYGKDVFVYLMFPNVSSYRLGTSFYSTIPRSTLVNDAGAGCNKTSTQADYCLTLIMKDGWRMADDYPW